MDSNKLIYALDFDGVICDSAVETAITGWKAAAVLWHDMQDTIPPAKIDAFRTFRPLIETGYETMLIMRLMSLGESFESVSQNYQEKIHALINESQVSIDALKKLFGATRDYWINNDLADWIAKNPLYAGAAEKLRSISENHIWYVITTKHERFVKLILQANQVVLPDENIYGLDRNMSKNEVLELLVNKHPGADIYFVEDRLPTLMNVLKNENLARVKLIFALWGYNTDMDKELAATLPVVSQKLEDFLV